MANLQYDRVYAKISPEPNTGCWIWTGSISSTGYGNAMVGGVVKNVHRALYELEKGPIKQGLELDHLCRNRWCVNPDHLEPVTGSENCLRGVGPQRAAEHQQAKTHCPKGHAYFGDNLYLYKGSRNGKVHRGCRECRRLQKLRYRK
jgi:hypothetical protein